MAKRGGKRACREWLLAAWATPRTMGQERQNFLLSPLCLPPASGFPRQNTYTSDGHPGSLVTSLAPSASGPLICLTMKYRNGPRDEAVIAAGHETTTQHRKADKSQRSVRLHAWRPYAPCRIPELYTDVQ